MTLAPYQLLPALTADELHDLRASIETHGVMVPVLIDGDGDVIDGHHRQQIADELGIDYPVAQRADLTETEKRTLALDLNLHRRHLSREQKREVIARSLAADPHLSNRQHAERTGASHPTVAAVRSELESTGKIYQSDERMSADGRVRPSTQPERPEPINGHAPEPDPAPAPRPAPLTPEERRAKDRTETVARYARFIQEVTDGFEYLTHLADGPLRHEIAEALIWTDHEAIRNRVLPNLAPNLADAIRPLLTKEAP